MFFIPCLVFFDSKKNSPHIVALQDVPLWNNTPPVFQNYKCFFPPASDTYKPRVAIYVYQSLLEVVSILPMFFDRGDLMAVNVYSPEGLFDSSHKLFRLYNAYSIASGHVRSVSPLDLFPLHVFPTLVLGDLNLHHSLSDPERILSDYELNISGPYFNKASDNSFTLLNTPGVFTRFPFTYSHRPGVLDLAFANMALFSFFMSWNPSLPPTGSDHAALSLVFSTPLLRSIPATPDWKRTDWSRAGPLLRAFAPQPPPAFPSPHTLDHWFDLNISKITHVLTSNTPTKRPSPHSKPWWNADLSTLRRISHHTTRLMRRDLASPKEARLARNTYFKAIQVAKRLHWTQFLSDVDSKSVWKAKKIASGQAPDRFPVLDNATTPTEINSALLSHFFPPRPSPPAPLLLPPFRDFPPITPDEISTVLRKSSNSSAPGPSRIPYSVWKEVHKLNDTLLPSLLTPLLAHGHHPPSLKKANGIVLAKPGKPDYRTPASFRIIVLLETVSKILERLVALRLASSARTLGLLHPNQCGSLAGLSCFDAAATLNHEVRLLQAASLQVSTLFLDVKGGFDNVCANKLANILRRGGVPAYLVAWIKSFLSQRRCCLIFQGSPRTFDPVAVGTPQGSPISPLLFVMYVSGLHPSIPQGVTLSYVDDFTITVGSSSFRSNIQSLQHYFCEVQKRGTALGVGFSVPKTELIHWRTPKDRSPVCSAPIVINEMLFLPSQAVRWLGYWFTPAIHTSLHFLKRLALAEATFTTVRRLSAAGKGLSSWCNRKLVFGAILPILTYGSDLFTPDSSTMKKLDAFWHKVLRWTTNCFRTTPIGALYIEASLPPMATLLKHRRRQAALRLVCSPSKHNPAAARLPDSVPSFDPGRSADDHRFLLRGSRKAIHITSWDRPAVNSAKHLPLDALCHLVHDLIRDIPVLPLTPSSQSVASAGREPSTSFAAIRATLEPLLLADWIATARPPPAQYLFDPALSPHAFTGLPRFIGGRIHQMRSGASYLAAHSSWWNCTDSKLCPFCEEDEESFPHAVLHCPAKCLPRLANLSGIDDLGPDAPLWSSVPLLRGLAEYLYATRTGFPPAMQYCRAIPSSPPSSPEDTP